MEKDYKTLYENEVEKNKMLNILCDYYKEADKRSWNAYKRVCQEYDNLQNIMAKLRKENYCLKVENSDLKFELNLKK